MEVPILLKTEDGLPRTPIVVSVVLCLLAYQDCDRREDECGIRASNNVVAAEGQKYSRPTGSDSKGTGSKSHNL
jgi:hypothetical protein